MSETPTADRSAAGAPAREGLASPQARRPLLTVVRAVAIVGGLVSTAVAIIVTVSVLLRWTTSDSIPGDFEIAQIGTALAVFAFLPLCAARRGNVMVDTFTTWLPARLQAGLDALWDLVYGGVAALLSWRLAVGAAETTANATTTMVLGLPVGWAISPCAGLAALLALTALATAVVRLREAA